MAWEKPYHNYTRIAGADLRAAQYLFVKLDGSGNVVLCAAATDKPLGILQNDPNTGEEANVMVVGFSKVVADGAVGIDNPIGTSADGQCDAKVHGTDTTNFIVGRAVEACSNAGEIITVMIDCMNPHRGA